MTVKYFLLLQLLDSSLGSTDDFENVAGHEAGEARGMYMMYPLTLPPLCLLRRQVIADKCFFAIYQTVQGGRVTMCERRRGGGGPAAGGPGRGGGKGWAQCE